MSGQEYCLYEPQFGSIICVAKSEKVPHQPLTFIGSYTEPKEMVLELKERKALSKGEARYLDNKTMPEIYMYLCIKKFLKMQSVYTTNDISRSLKNDKRIKQFMEEALDITMQVASGNVISEAFQIVQDQ